MSNLRFRLACRMLRKSGRLDVTFPHAKRGESPIDYLVRAGLAADPHAAAFGLIEMAGLRGQLDSLIAGDFGELGEE